jgi:hypothetical protein
MPHSASRSRKTSSSTAQRKSGAGNSILLLSAIWATVLAIIFVANRRVDILQFSSAAASFPDKFSGFSIIALRDTILGACLVAALAIAWFGFGTLVETALAKLSPRDQVSRSWRAGTHLAYGAGITSLLTFALGIAHLYRPAAAIALLLVGLALAVWTIIRTPRTTTSERRSLSWAGAIVVILPLSLAGLASLAPPIAKDTLLYHISLPKAFIQAGGLVDVPLNIAQYYALGAEMNGTLAMLLGKIVNARVAEAAFGLSQFAYLPILALITFGWMRSRESAHTNALLATALVVAVPTIYASASSGYNDVALAVYVTLAAASAANWWRSPDMRSALEMGIATGFALTVKLLAVFLVAALVIIFLLKLRQLQNDNAAVRKGAKTYALSLFLAFVICAPWFARTWANTGSPVFPFYMNVFGGSASGWDEPRSFVDQLSNARYGGYPKSLLDYAATPLRVSLTAQPDEPPAFDGVLGFSFLLGIPLLLFAWKRKQLDAEWLIATAIASLWFVFWMFSSQQLRYLLPALPALAVTIVTAASALESRLKTILWATAIPALLVGVTWFAQQNPLAVLIGAESRDHYLARSIDHYSIYADANARLPQDARVWLIDVRGDTYHIERPYRSEFRIEHTFPQLVLSSNSVDELRARVRDQKVTHLLARTDILLNYEISQLVDDRLPREENERKLQLLRNFLFNGKVISKNDSFVLIEP